MGQKRKNCKEKNDFEYDPVPKYLLVAHIRNQEKRLIVILENAQLESVKCVLIFKMGQKRKNCKEKNDFEYDPVPKYVLVAQIRHQEKRLIVILENAQLESVKRVVIFKMGQKRKNCKEKNDFEYDPVPKCVLVAQIRRQEKRLIVILENAQLESVKVGNSFELLNCDDHINILRKNNREPGSCRPDITHQCLLMLMDSPLNRAGLLQVFIHTEKNVLIEINPQTRIPRTFKRFAGLIVQLLHKFSVRASDGPMKLLKVIKNPCTDYFPVGCKKLLMSFNSNNIKNPRELVPVDEPIVIVVGAMAHGQVRTDYTEDIISISNYPLSGAITCSKLCSAFEEVWGIV